MKNYKEPFSETSAASGTQCTPIIITLSALRGSLWHLVLSRFDLCNGVVAELPKNQLDCLQSVLHTAARLIFGGHRRDHVTPLLRQRHWLSVPERVEFKPCVLAYHCLRGLGPAYLSIVLRSEVRVQYQFMTETAFFFHDGSVGSCYTTIYARRPRYSRLLPREPGMPCHTKSLRRHSGGGY